MSVDKYINQEIRKKQFKCNHRYKLICPNCGKFKQNNDSKYNRQLHQRRTSQER